MEDAERSDARVSEIYSGSLDCVHCGLCLSSCPTYRISGREASSPRGRVYLMRGEAEGRIELADLLAEEAFLCLGCRACETACPSGVRFGAMLELTRDKLRRAGLRRGVAARLERLLLRRLIPHPRRLHLLVNLLGLLQWSRLDRLALHFVPRWLRGLWPAVPAAVQRKPLPAHSAAEGERRGRVALFTGCVMQELFGPVNWATLRVLRRNGFDVLVPEEQGCCGALQAHAGDLDFARELARCNAKLFQDAGVDALIVNSAGCSAAMREAPQWIANEGVAYAGMVRDVCEFLAETGVRPPAGRIDARVCYDDPCHLVHGQQVAEAPRALLRGIVGLELVPHADAASCCGAAGTYNLTQPAMSEQILARKLDALEAVDPDLIASGNPGCLMQLRRGVRERGLRARVVHPIELLDQAYGTEPASDTETRRGFLWARASGGRRSG